MSITSMTFHPADRTLLAWHVRLALDISLPARVLSVRVNQEAIEEWLLRQDGRIVPTLVTASGHGVRKPGSHVSSASTGGEFQTAAGYPELVIFLPWAASREYRICVELQRGDVTRELEARAIAPAAGAFPCPGFTCQRVFHYRETAGLARHREPVELMLSAYTEECGNWQRELRMQAMEPRSGTLSAIPFQVIRETRANHTAVRRRDQCSTAWVMAFLDLAPNTDLMLICAWGQADAQAAAMDEFSPDLCLQEDNNGWRHVRNAHYDAGLCPRSGQLGSLTACARPDRALYYAPGNNQSHRFLHYNPDLWIPDQVWSHASDWDPPPYATEAAGPLVLRTRRWGALPRIHGVQCCVEYTFCAWTPWIRTRTVLEVDTVLSTNAIRNEEIVMNADQVDWWACKETDGVIRDEPIHPDPDLPSGIVAVVRNEAPWIAFYHQDSGVGLAGIRLQQQATTRGNAEKAYWNTGTVVADYGWGFRYWSRSLIYGTGDFWPDREYVVEPGLLYVDECAYLPFTLMSGTGFERFEQIEAAEARLRFPVERIWRGSGPY